MATELSRRYLRAMGIESWQHRQSPLASGVEAAAVSQSSAAATTSRAAETAAAGQQPAAASQSVTPSAIATCAVAELDGMLADSRVTVTVTDAEYGKVPLLLLLERELTDAASELLSAMLKAIKLDRATLPVAIMRNATDIPAVSKTAVSETEPLAAVCKRINPTVLVVMASLNDSTRLTDLDAQRETLHQFGWLNAQVVVTLHPQVLLDNPDGKRPAWEDLKRVQALLDAG